MKKYYSTILAILMLVISISSIAFIKFEIPKKNNKLFFETAHVLAIADEKLQKDTVVPDLFIGYQDVEIEILTGELMGQIFKIRNSISRLYNVHLHEDMEVIVSIDPNNKESVSIYSYKRSNILYLLVAIFFIITFIVGGKRGFKSILSLIFSAIMILFFMIPLIFKGFEPMAASIITVFIIISITLPFIHGVSKKTLGALLGTIFGILISGVIAFIFGKMSMLSGLSMNDADYLLYLSEKAGFNIKGMLFATILIASLGAMMDVAISVASSIAEMKLLKTTITAKELFKSGMNVGKDILGTMVNTLILALVGASFTTILLIISYDMPFLQLVNIEIVNSELIQALSGSIGIVLTVPITAIITVYLLGKTKLKPK